jgi:hypothetical protein
MRLAGMNQLAVAVKESLKTLAVDNYTEDDKKASSVQNRYIDSVELSDRAIELSMQADTETDFNEESETGFEEESDTDQGQEGNPGTNQRQEPAFTEAVSLNVLV